MTCSCVQGLVSLRLEATWPLETLTSISQKLRRVLLLVGVVDSGVLGPAIWVLPTVWVKVIEEGHVLKTREPLRCLVLSFTSFASGRVLSRPKTEGGKQTHETLSPT